MVEVSHFPPPPPPPPFPRQFAMRKIFLHFSYLVHTPRHATRLVDSQLERLLIQRNKNKKHASLFLSVLLCVCVCVWLSVCLQLLTLWFEEEEDKSSQKCCRLALSYLIPFIFLLFFFFILALIKKLLCVCCVGGRGEAKNGWGNDDVISPWRVTPNIHTHTHTALHCTALLFTRNNSLNKKDTENCERIEDFALLCFSG